MTAITATTTTTIYADSDNGNDKDRDATTDTEQATTDTETEEETQAEEQTASATTSRDEVAKDNPGNGDTQPGRVGSHDNDRQTSGEGANEGGTVTDSTITGDPDTVDEDDTVSADCFGKVISHEAQEHKDPDSDEGTLGNIVQTQYQN